MLNRIKTAGLAALIGLGTLAGAPGAAQADSLYFGFGIGASDRDRIPGESFRSHRDDRRDWRRGRDQRDWRRGRQHRRCTPGEALRKAERLGMRRARVAGVNRRVIRIVGRKDHWRTQMVFARAPRCPVVRW